MSAATEKAKETAKKAMPTQALTPNFTQKDYGIFFLAGAICCTATHGAMTPIDVIKTRIQIDPALSRNYMYTAGRKIIAAEGPGGLLTGFAPTAVGYLVQGGAKFAGYEFWKKKFVEMAGSKEAAIQHRTAIYLTSASIAEFFADILLTPLEATRIRLVSNPKYATNMAAGLSKIVRTEGVGALYAGFLPLIFKQIPYAIGQFTVNEFMHELAYRYTSKETQAQHKLAITLGSGITAGFAAAILSHPADTLLSQINKGHGPSGPMIKRLYILGKQAGIPGLFAGLGPRMIMTAGLVTGQFVIYKWVKELLDAPAGVEIHKGKKN